MEIFGQPIPEGYAIYNRRLSNHRKYGEKIHLGNDRHRYPHYIRFQHDYADHAHYVSALRRDSGTPATPWGWALEAMPYLGALPAPAEVNDHDLSLFAPNNAEEEAINIALYAIDDHGLVADVDRFRGLAEAQTRLRAEQEALDKKLATWRDQWGPVRSRLINARARSRVHPYLENEAPVPLPYDERPRELRHAHLTVSEALGRFREEGVRWLPRPWYHDEDYTHTTEASVLRPPSCYYCTSPYHIGYDCLRPHARCDERACCVVPRHHKSYTSGAPTGGCPHQDVHIHDDPSDEYWTYDSSDGES